MITMYMLTFYYYINIIFLYNIKMEENKFRYCKILLIDNDSNSKIFISEKNKYYVRNYNKSIHIKILNKFRDIKKSYKINVNDTSDNYYKADIDCIKKHWTILLIDDYDHSKIFVSKKNLYYTTIDCEYSNIDVDNYEFNDYDYDDDYYYWVYDNIDFYNDDNYYDNDDYDDYLYYKKSFNKFERLVFVKNNIVDLINNNGNDIKPLLLVKNITLSVDNINIFIYENVY